MSAIAEDVGQSNLFEATLALRYLHETRTFTLLIFSG